MYSRVSRFKLPADKLGLVVRAMQARVDAGPQRHESFVGFAGETLLIDRDRAEAVLIRQALSVDEYGVAVSDIPSPITSA